MAKRLIDDSILVSPDFIDLGFRERWLWLGLCLITDDYGWVNADPRYLKHRIAPSLRLSIDFIERTLGLYQDRSMIIVCTLDGAKCLQLLNFEFFQKLKRRRFSKYNELEKRREEKEEKDGILSSDELRAATAAYRDEQALGATIQKVAEGRKLRG